MPTAVWKYPLAPGICGPRGRVAVHSIDFFLQSRGWPLGKDSAVYNSAYVHFSWGLWVSQEGRSLCLCPKRQHESQLYGNGLLGGGGALPNRPRCLRSRKPVCSPVLLTQTQQGHSAVTLRHVWGHLAQPPFHCAGQPPCRHRVWAQGLALL